MNPDIFNKMAVLDQIDYINMKLEEGYTLTKLDNENIISSRKTISKRFEKMGYKFNKDTKRFESYIEVVQDENILNEICITEDNILKSSNKVVGGTQVINREIEELILNYKSMNDKLNEVYSWYQESSEKVVIEDKKLNIENFEGKIVTRSYKLYEPIQKEFTEFCKVNNKYKVQDILCQALKEFLQRYK